VINTTGDMLWPLSYFPTHCSKYTKLVSSVATHLCYIEIHTAFETASMFT